MKNTCFIGTKWNQSCTECFARDLNSCGHHLSPPLSSFKRHCFPFSLTGDVHNTVSLPKRQIAQNFSVDRFHLLKCCLFLLILDIWHFLLNYKGSSLHNPCQLLKRHETPTVVYLWKNTRLHAVQCFLSGSYSYKMESFVHLWFCSECAHTNTPRGTRLSRFKRGLSDFSELDASTRLWISSV